MLVLFESILCNIEHLHLATCGLDQTASCVSDPSHRRLCILRLLAADAGGLHG